MLRIDKQNKALIALEPKTMRESGYWERAIQDMVCRSPGPFCNELGEYIHFVGSEVAPVYFVQDRIDLLGVDPDGVAVVIEMKRDSHKLHLLQALAYAGMVAKWEPKQFFEELRKFNHRWSAKPELAAQTLEDAKEELEDILDEADVEGINRSQRIVLLAEEFDFEVLVTAEWLIERYDVDIRCYRIALAKNGSDEFLTCTRTFPPPEITDIAIRRRRKRETGTTPSVDWAEALKTIETEAVARFFEEELAKGRSNSVKYRLLRFDLGGRRRFLVYGKKLWARTWQNGRFDNDIEFWNARLSGYKPTQVVSGGNGLRLYLHSESDVQNFRKAVESELVGVHFGGEQEHEPDDSDQSE